MATSRTQPRGGAFAPVPQAPLLRNPLLRRVLLVEERVVVAQRRHWAAVVEPVVTALVGFLVAGFLFAGIEERYGVDVGLVWLLGFVPLARAAWRLLEWHRHWFVATDKRLLMTTGVINQRVGMMPMGKVTDMSYTRSFLGQVLQYGTFVLESAGQDQAMRRIDFVVRPDDTYRRICDTLFGTGGTGGTGGPGSTDSAGAPRTGTPASPVPPPPSVVPGSSRPRPGRSDGGTMEIPTRPRA
ncbi:PH domain-containing protein [Luteimicrobium subarcticum]|uniref:PH domain-containing protein n=1 Tax=Luteimicrobium subarcticum TaxID=620910 RepID=UPI0012FD5D8B|nr:PH domain-containing protein [Luteimicrobium subarcticum]